MFCASLFWKVPFSQSFITTYMMSFCHYINLTWTLTSSTSRGGCLTSRVARSVIIITDAVQTLTNHFEGLSSPRLALGDSSAREDSRDKPPSSNPSQRQPLRVQMLHYPLNSRRSGSRSISSQQTSGVGNDFALMLRGVTVCALCRSSNEHSRRHNYPSAGRGGWYSN